MSAEDVRLEKGLEGLQRRLRRIKIQAAHCHECDEVDPIDVYRPLCYYGHAMDVCLITKHTLLKAMSIFS